MSLDSKDPQSKLDYTIDWSQWLYEGDEIETSDWDVVSGGVSITDKVHSQTATTVWLEAGTLGEDAQVVNTINTTGGRIDQRTLTIPISQR